MNELLGFLLENQGHFLSGEKLASHFGITRNSIWKKINRLREQGFEIDSVPKNGYRLLSIPKDKLFSELILKDVKGNFLRDLLVYEEIDSTNLEAKRQINQGRNGNFLILANSQVAGKGRLDRVWKNNAGKDIAMTLVLDLREPIGEFYRYTMMTSVALTRTFEEFGVNAKIKWPNDLYIEEKKICGILSEMQTEENVIRHLMIGIGINVNSLPLLPVAVSCKQILNRDIDRHQLVARFLDVFEETIALKTSEGFKNLYIEWKNKMNWMGRKIRIDTGREVLEGILKNVSESGGIILEIDGKEQEFYSGDLMGL